MIFFPNIKRSVAVLLLGHVLTTAFSQTDTSYIGQYDQDFALSAYLFHNFFSLSKIVDEDEISFVPNKPMSAGISFYHKKLPFDIALGYYLGKKEDDSYLKTKGIDIQLHRYMRMYVADFTVQYYNGFYIDDSDLSNEASNCKDLSIFEASLGGQYIFNGDNFSCQAAFDQNEKQLKSVGSLLIGSALYYSKVQSDSSFTYQNRTDLSAYQLGLSVGYAYNWVVNEYWLVSGSLAVGANFGNESLRTFFNKDFYVSPTAQCRSSVFYNRDKWSVGMSFVFNSVALKYTDNSQIDLNSGRFYIKCVRRFKLKNKK